MDEVYSGSYGNVQFGNGYLDISSGTISNVKVISGGDVSIISTSNNLSLSSGNVFILFLQQSINLKIVKLELNKMLFIVEFLLLNKKMIFKDNAYILVVNIQIIKLLKTLNQDLITKDLDFLNYWKCLINNNSMKWLSLARIDFVETYRMAILTKPYKTIQNHTKPYKNPGSR
jgi:hypothetical protein